MKKIKLLFLCAITVMMMGMSTACSACGTGTNDANDTTNGTDENRTEENRTDENRTDDTDRNNNNDNGSLGDDIMDGVDDIGNDIENGIDDMDGNTTDNRETDATDETTTR